MPAKAIIVDDPARQSQWYKWHLWWRLLPGWLRILCITGSVLTLLICILAIRVAIGLQEADEIKQLRERGAQIYYPWHNLELVRPNTLPRSWIRSYVKLRDQYKNVVAGLYGLSAQNVDTIYLQFGDCDDLWFITTHFHKLGSLTFSRSLFTSESIRSLNNCPRLEFLDLSYSDLDDNAVELLKPLNQLTELRLGATLVTDNSVPILQQMKSLKKVDLWLTDIIPETIQAWRKDGNAPALSNGSDQIPIGVRGVIRWSDGTRSANFLGPWRLITIDEASNETVASNSPGLVGLFGRNDMSWPGPPIPTSGVSKMTLKLGECESETVTLRFTDDGSTTRQFEFMMPCTHEQALRSVDPESSHRRFIRR